MKMQSHSNLGVRPNPRLQAMRMKPRAPELERWAARIGALGGPMKLMLCLPLFLSVTPSVAAVDGSETDIDYAVHAAALGAAISYCHAKYGAVTARSPGGECFGRAKMALTGFDLQAASANVKRRCPDASTLQRCITPQLSDVVNALLRIFDAKRM